MVDVKLHICPLGDKICVSFLIWSGRQIVDMAQFSYGRPLENIGVIVGHDPSYLQRIFAYLPLDPPTILKKGIQVWITSHPPQSSGIGSARAKPNTGGRSQFRCRWELSHFKSSGYEDGQFFQQRVCRMMLVMNFPDITSITTPFSPNPTNLDYLLRSPFQNYLTIESQLCVNVESL